MRRYALPLQLHFLATRFEALRRMRSRRGGWIIDRTWYEDAEIFARGAADDGRLSPDEFALYERLYTELLTSPAAKPPRLLVYLHAPIETILERIERRGREKERETSPDYWRALHARYARWIADFRRCPVLSLDVRDYDVIGDPPSGDRIVRRIRAELEPDIPQVEIFD
jgi:deoxyadenosine/deoxycytidine kinase